MANSSLITRRTVLQGSVALSTVGAAPMAAQAYADVPAPYAERRLTACTITDDSMAPRYENGETVFFDDDAPVRIGDYVVAVFSPYRNVGGDRVYVRRLVHIDDTVIVLYELRDHWVRVLPLWRLISLNKIIYSGELIA